MNIFSGQHFSRHRVDILSKFLFGDMTFMWTSSTNTLMYNVSISKDTTPGPWSRVYNTQYTVRNALLFKNITINVKLQITTLNIYSGQLFCNSKFIFGDMTFKGTSPTNSSWYNVLITKDMTPGPWTRVYDTQYTVRDAFSYNNISINVRLPSN